jgi:pimeloyl-ACP methyl ester carboxylesterase
VELEARGERVYVSTGNRPLDASKETVVFVHGVGQDHTIWVLPTRYFARHDRNVLAPDLPGHGRSGGQPLKTIEEMADWIVELLDVCEVDRASVVGHSMGSLVALDVASRHPDRVRSAALVGVSVPLAVNDHLMGSAEHDSHDAIDMMTFWGHSRWAQIGGSPTPGMWMTGTGMRLWERAGPGVIHTDLRACDEYSAGLDQAQLITCPVLLLLGEKDVMTPVRVAKRLAEALQDQETVIFEGAGHALLSERADPVLDELIRIV